MQQAQFELVESVRILREAQGQGVQLPRAELDLQTQQERGSVIGNPQFGEKKPLHNSLSLYLISLLYWRKKEVGSGRSLCITFASPHIQQSYLANHIRRSMKHLPSPFMMGEKGMQ